MDSEEAEALADAVSAAGHSHLAGVPAVSGSGCVQRVGQGP